jgi:hypothetical protein
MQAIGRALLLLALVATVAGFGSCGGFGAWYGLRTLAMVEGRYLGWGLMLLGAGALGLWIAASAARQAWRLWQAWRGAPQ